MNIQGVGNQLIKELVSKKITFSKFIYALGIREVGESSSRALASEFKSIDELIKCDYEHLVEIHDIGPIVAKNILLYFKDKYYKSNVDNLISSGIDLIYQIFMKLMDTKYQILYPRKPIF